MASGISPMRTLSEFSLLPASMTTSLPSTATRHQPKYIDFQQPDASMPMYQMRYTSINTNTTNPLYYHLGFNAFSVTPSISPPSISIPVYSDHDQYTTQETFEAIVQDYLRNLSVKKRDKALINQARYAMILQVLKNPRNTAVSTAQFRFWVKKMFRLYNGGNCCGQILVCHDGKPVAMREQLYDILISAHREAHHGGRDKTSALVRQRYSWIPKELIARFVRHCPFCISRRNGTSLQHQLETYFETDDFIERQREPSLISSASCDSFTTSYAGEGTLMAAATSAHQRYQQQCTISKAYQTANNANKLWQQQQQQQQQQYVDSGATSIATDGGNANRCVTGMTTPKSDVMTHHALGYCSSVPRGSTDIVYALNETMILQTAGTFPLANSSTQPYMDTDVSSHGSESSTSCIRNQTMVPVYNNNTLLLHTNTTCTPLLDCKNYSPSQSPCPSTASAFSTPPAHYNVCFNDKVLN